MQTITKAGVCALLVSLLSVPVWADQGTVSKWLQRPFAEELAPTMPMQGENIASDIDWRLVQQSTTFPQQPNWTVADDFQSNGLPILTVRWWGSYFDPSAGGGTNIGPGFEEGYVLSFFSDQPASPLGPPFSQPKDLLATYIAPLGVVRITPTPLIGWDGHPIWEYEVNLQDTHLDHALADDTGQVLADEIAFNEKAGDIYWLSIVAENGHELLVTPNPDGSGTTDWVFSDNGDLIPSEHFWGWHTSPDAFNDVATMGHLLMPDPDTWFYTDWNPIQPLHTFDNMAFELLTIPEPASVALLVLGLLGVSRRKG